MKIVNKSRKIIGVGGEPLLPGASMEIDAALAKNPMIAKMVEDGKLADADVVASATTEEAERIAKEAVAAYIAKQEEEAAQTALEAEIAGVKAARKKDVLLTKAAGLGLEVSDSMKLEELKEQIIAALSSGNEEKA